MVIAGGGRRRVQLDGQRHASTEPAMVIAGGEPHRASAGLEPVASTEPAMVIAGGAGYVPGAADWVDLLQRSRRW